MIILVPSQQLSAQSVMRLHTPYAHLIRLIMQYPPSIPRIISNATCSYTLAAQNAISGWEEKTLLQACNCQGANVVADRRRASREVVSAYAGRVDMYGHVGSRLTGPACSGSNGTKIESRKGLDWFEGWQSAASTMFKWKVVMAGVGKWSL